MKLTQAERQDKEIFRTIFVENWDNFKNKYPICDNDQYEEPVQKMLNCSKESATSYKSPQYGVKSDGTVVQTGFTLSVLGLYPTQTKFTPYGGLGIGYYTGDFEETDHWGLGYFNQQDYEANGSTGLSNNGRTKWMTIDDEFAFIFTLGTTYDLPYNLKLDASVQYILLEANAHYYKSNDYGVTVEHNDDGTFPLDQLAFRLGVKYTF